jgi:cell wall-associated NlpC family hydrolase
MRSRQLDLAIQVWPAASRPARPAASARPAQVDFARLLAERTRRRDQLSADALHASVARPAPGAAGEEIVALARGQLGGRYVWGGEQPGAFDCSGLVQWAVERATGRQLPRVAADQARAGRPVERADLQPGDLVFFRGADGSDISHVGIYAGDGQFIHAASERYGIIVSRLDSPYWENHFAGARRVA